MLNHSLSTSAPETVTIPERFTGRPGFAHGGYTAGTVAEYVESATASVSLRRPVPLDTPLAVVRGDAGKVTLLAGPVVVARGEPAELELHVPEPVSLREARAARGGNLWLERHTSPSCFGCGVDRDRSEAIATLLGPVAGRPGVHADTWTPMAAFAGADGTVARRFLWAALGCPTGAVVDPHGGPHAAARLTVRLGPAPARVDEEHVVMAWPLGREGRKRLGAAALLTSTGEVCAIAEGMWIALRDPTAHGTMVGD